LVQSNPVTGIEALERQDFLVNCFKPTVICL
jgi:hypothetical protein